MNAKLSILAISIFYIQSANAFNVDISAKSNGANPPTIVGKTNLPNGTQLMISVERTENGYGGDAKTLVINGEFEAGPFKINGGHLTPGIYGVSVILVEPTTQLQHVKEVIGSSGKKLTGKLVKTYATGSKGAIYKTKFSIEGKIDESNDKKLKNSYEADQQHSFCTSGCSLKSNGNSITYNACIRACMK